jgi:hypothetical protein
MATFRFMGTSPAQAQVDTFTPANVEINDVFTLTVTGENEDTHAISFTATAATVANVTAGLTALWNADGHYLCTPITAADNTTNMTLTADTAGQPFSVASTEADGGGTDDQTFTRAATTASKGPYDYNDADNWRNEATGENGTMPAASDDIIFEDVTVLYGLDQTSGNDPANVTVKNSQIGQNPPAGVTAAYLQFTPDSDVFIDDSFNPGTLTHASPVMIDTQSSTGSVYVYGSGTNSTSTLPAVWIKQNSSGNARLIVKGGVVGLGYQDETVELNNLTVTGGSVYVGKNLTITASGTVDVSGGLLDCQSVLTTAHTWYVTGGQVNIRGDLDSATFYMDGGTVFASHDIATVHMTAGTLTTLNDNNEVVSGITTLNVRGGQVNYGSSKTITAATVYNGTLDMTSTNLAKTITTLLIGKGGKFICNKATTTLTNDVAFTTQDDDDMVTVQVS